MSYNAVIVSNGTPFINDPNGTYLLDGQENGKNKYVKDSFTISWNSLNWIFDDTGVGYYTGVEDTEFPWEVTTWTFDELILGEGATLPILTPIDTSASSQPTFGLPAETVALITSRHGSVANYLRLRNQGQV